MTRIANAPNEAFTAQQEEWVANAKADPEIGPRLPKVKENIGRAFDTLIAANPDKAPETRALITDFKLAMDTTGVGNHPAFIKVFNRLAERVIEGGHVTGGKPSQHGQSSNGTAAKPSVAQAMYPTLPA